MKRRNVQMAFTGEGATPERDMEFADGDEAIDVEVSGGKLMIVVPSRTPDGQIFERAARLGGELVLEDGTRLSFEIEDGATGAQFSATGSDHLQDDTHPGLSALPDVPGGT